MAMTDPRGIDNDADDVAIWVHPTDPTLSLVIGSNHESRRGGVQVFELSGKERQFVELDRINGVDVRYGFRLGSQSVDLVAASNRDRSSVQFLAVDPAARALRQVGEVRSSRSSIEGVALAPRPAARSTPCPTSRRAPSNSTSCPPAAVP
jgi:3-phytase